MCWFTARLTCIGLRIPPPPFSHDFQISPKIKSDSIEIFTTDRASKMIGYMFEENISKNCLHGFFIENTGFREVFILTWDEVGKIGPIRLKFFWQIPIGMPQR